MKLITKEEIYKIAHMSRISINTPDIDSVILHIESILAYAARVNEVATLEQHMTLPVNKNIFRPDQINPFDSDRIKAESDNVEAGYFVVPPILEHE